MLEPLLLAGVIALLVYAVGMPLGVKIVLPEGVQMSGSIGGVTYSHNRSGYYRRNRSVPVNPNTDKQVGIRNLMRSLSIAWQNTLTQAQRDAWDLYAANVTVLDKQGQSIYLTGLNHYIRSNVPLLDICLARVDDGPVIFTLATAELSLGCTASEATQQWTLTWDDTAAWASEDGAAEITQQGRPQNAGIKFFGGPWRRDGYIEGDSGAPPTSPTVLTSQWPFAQNQRLWIRSRITRADGRLSEFAQYNFLAGA